ISLLMLWAEKPEKLSGQKNLEDAQASPLEWNAIALSSPVRIAFLFASHALESQNDLVLMTQHSSFPSRASVPCEA
ncbi:MAG: hypothetical protein PV344_01790, partial [Anaplasma sp.]|nr:hypothetical protein [Anaplasma sp.]